MLQTCVFRSTSSPGPCDKAKVRYHSALENGNPQPSRMLKKDVGYLGRSRARATRGLRRMRRERPGALLARKTRTMKRCSSDARS